MTLVRSVIGVVSVRASSSLRSGWALAVVTAALMVETKASLADWMGVTSPPLYATIAESRDFTDDSMLAMRLVIAATSRFTGVGPRASTAGVATAPQARARASTVEVNFILMVGISHEMRYYSQWQTFAQRQLSECMREDGSECGRWMAGCLRDFIGLGTGRPDLQIAGRPTT